jgi:hypothetical protein
VRQLPASVWFVRSNGGQSSYPVTREGWLATAVFVAGMLASGLMGWVLAITMPTWLWIVIMALGMAASALWFITTARAHTDYSITYNDFVKAKKNVGNT